MRDTNTNITNEQNASALLVVCLSCLLDWSIENDLRVGMYDVDNETILFDIIDEKSEEPLTFSFMNKYPLTGDEWWNENEI